MHLRQEAPIEKVARQLCLAFNGSFQAMSAIHFAARKGDAEAANLAAWMAVHGLDQLPCTPLPPAQAYTLGQDLLDRPAAFLTGASAPPYPFTIGDRHYGFEPSWVQKTQVEAAEQLKAFAAGRRSETAVLVGNGPSLNQTNLELLRGQDVYISNYAIKHPLLRDLARGVAVSNPLVAEQEPHVFQLNDLWKFHPLWLGYCLRETPRTVWLNALGGEMFFSEDVTQRIAWHATVSFFWLQILYHAGYRKIVLIGVDNSYQQAANAREGDFIHQAEDDANHFDPNYFKGKTWQAADTDNMAATFHLARTYFEADGREIVNCTVGGRLEAFRRADLRSELAHS